MTESWDELGDRGFAGSVPGDDRHLARAKRHASVTHRVKSQCQVPSHGQSVANKIGSSASSTLGPAIIGADDGIRTRDPHLGKAMILVHIIHPSVRDWASVHPVSTQSTELSPVVERSTTSGVTLLRSPPSLPRTHRQSLDERQSHRSHCQRDGSANTPSALRGISQPRRSQRPTLLAHTGHQRRK